MLFWCVLCLCVLFVGGVPSPKEKCLQISVAEWTSGRDGVVVLKLQGDQSVKHLLCDGVHGDISIRLDKEALHLVFIGSSGISNDLSKLTTTLSAGLKHRIQYTCVSGHRSLCLDLTARNNSSHSNTYRTRRQVFMDNEDPQEKPDLPNWMVAAVGATLSVVLLSVTVLLCVKSSAPSEVNLSQSTGLKIIDGPPPEYLETRKKANSVIVTEHHSTVDNTMTQEAKMKLDHPSSPSSMSDDRPESISPLQDVPKSKKTKNPLPPTPGTLKEVHEKEEDQVNKDEDNGDDDDENPYDVAADIMKDADNSNTHDGGLSLPPPLPAGGSYAKVSRHSGVLKDQKSSYAEVTEVKHTHVGRMRSSTEPPEPLPPLPPITKPRAMSGNEASHMPLPNPPTTPTSVKDKPYVEALESLESNEKVYDLLDDDENDEMYECVPEDLKEELVGSIQPVPLPPRSPKGVDGSPSPTKHPFEHLPPPDSPMSRKAAKKASKKKGGSTTHIEEDTHKPKMSLLNRFRSSSTSTSTGKSRKEKRSIESSPDHTHLTEPIPLPPDSIDDDDDDNGMYDSVDPAQIMDIKLRASTLPIAGTRSSTLFYPRAAEPLPEVPEDSGSGSKGGGAIMVTRERHTEKDDPNYDIVTGTKKSQMLDDDDEEDDNYDVVRVRENPLDEDDSEEEEDPYDTVRPRADSPINSPQLPPGHSYAKVTGHNPPLTKGGSVDHDDKGYAVVDPSIVKKKRATSITKQKSEDKSTSSEPAHGETDEPPYDRVRKEGEMDEELPSDKENEPPYDKVKKGENDTDKEEIEEPPYDQVKKKGEMNDEPLGSGEEMDEPPYDKVKKEGENDTDKDGSDEEMDEPPYDKVKKEGENDTDKEMEEPPYDQVKKGEMNDELPGSDGEMDEPPYDKVMKLNEETIKGDGEEPPYDKVQKNDDKRTDPGYASVTATASNSNNVGEDSQAESPPVGRFDFTTTATISVQDATYSQVDLAKKHEHRKQKKQDSTVSADKMEVKSPSPPLLPPPCTLEDLSDTPPIQSPQDDDDSDNDPNYDIVGPGTIKTFKLNSHTGGITQLSGGDSSLTSENTNGVSSNSSSIDQDDTHIYDCLAPTYDSLEEVQRQS